MENIPINGITLRGIDALVVEVEVEITQGLFQMAVVGLPDAAVKESRERVRAALKAADIPLKGRVAINLAPADLLKEGSLLDLPIAVALAEKLGAVDVRRQSIFLGELALDGRVRGVRGAVPAAMLARKLGMPLYFPKDNSDEVALVKDLEAYPVESVSELIDILNGSVCVEPLRHCMPDNERIFTEPDFSDIKGQLVAKRALEIAAAGHHNILMVGSPGSGKTLLARALRGILPPLADDELLECILIRSAAGIQQEEGRTRPFRQVHHTASTVSVCGGGQDLRPGEVSMAHRGVLFLDEFTEFKRDLTEALRQPIEDGYISITRAIGSVVYPSRVLLALAANPCPCGWKGDTVEPCRCSNMERERYGRRFSGPMLDRVDLYVSVPRLTPQELLDQTDVKREGSAQVRERVVRARKLQWSRAPKTGVFCNAELPERILRNSIGLTPEARGKLGQMAERLRLSGRGISRVLRVARTISDLAEEERISPASVMEALAYRDGGVVF